jgi:hypothetical protein
MCSNTVCNFLHTFNAFYFLEETLEERKRNISYVIINPSFDLELVPGDIIYVLRPPLVKKLHKIHNFD